MRRPTTPSKAGACSASAVTARRTRRRFGPSTSHHTEVIPLTSAPPEFPDLADITHSFINAGGDFVVAELDGDLVGMAGFRANELGQAQVLRVRVHPAVRRQHLGSHLMSEVEQRARNRRFAEAFLDTSTYQPEAMAFYVAIGYHEVGRETRPEWNWTLVYYCKPLGPDRSR